MKVNEILHAKTLSDAEESEILDVDKTNKTKVHHVDNYILYTYIDSDGLNVYFLEDEDETTIAATYAKRITINNKEYLQPLNVAVLDEFKGNRLAGQMYVTISWKNKMPIISDIMQTESGRKLWFNINKTVGSRMYVINVNSGKKISNDINDAYTDWLNEPAGLQTALVFESDVNRIRVIGKDVKIFNQPKFSKYDNVL